MEKGELLSILIIEQHVKTADALKAILRDDFTVFIVCSSAEEALKKMENIEVGLVLLNIDTPYFNNTHFLKHLKNRSDADNIYTIVYSDSLTSATSFVKGLNEGAVDYFTKPFNPNLIKAKVNVYKSFYFKDRKIDQLLSNILPKRVIESYETKGYYEPKKVDSGVVLFTDFVQFSNHSAQMQPIQLLNKLDLFFSHFDFIVDRYKVQKIKTIGDAYMALAGVNHTYPFHIIRATLAALEIRNWIINKNETAKALAKPYWQIRIGIHAGPLVSGVIGKKKITFDVWGDTVNIASRAEQNSLPNEINVTQVIVDEIEAYFELALRGEMEIPKRGGTFKVYFIKQLKPQYSIDGEGRLPNALLRKKIGLPAMDFDYARIEILEILKSNLPDNLSYHSYQHILDVEASAITIAEMEGLKGEELILLRTAVILHDTGYAYENEDNVQYAILLAQKILPKYGYSSSEVKQVINMINASKFKAQPSNLIEEIICDANLDYLGREDYYEIADLLREELSLKGKKMTEREWIERQIDYMENKHRYYTNTSKNIRMFGKQKRISELKLKLAKL
jgi:class 3 adenylate cyclase/HD superfamily phosphodiesterase